MIRTGLYAWHGELDTDRDTQLNVPFVVMLLSSLRAIHIRLSEETLTSGVKMQKTSTRANHDETHTYRCSDGNISYYTGATLNLEYT
jgi:hypothetical protein